jgi:serine/threonine protein kinase
MPQPGSKIDSVDESRAGGIRELLAARYDLLGVLGEGSMGVVYDALHRALGRKVAIKTLHAKLGDDPELVRRFQIEARAAGALGHQNIVQVFDAGELGDGGHFLVMERVDGGSLADALGGGALAVRRAVDLACQILAGLGAAHRRGIVHRDLKPDNILLSRDEDGREVAKIADFGISKVLDPARLGASLSGSATQHGLLLGTPLYMSPEQARGEVDVDARSDLWAVGCVLYQMLSGTTPFDGPRSARRWPRSSPARWSSRATAASPAPAPCATPCSPPPAPATEPPRWRRPRWRHCPHHLRPRRRRRRPRSIWRLHRRGTPVLSALPSWRCRATTSRR